jgi:DNA-directed RNA polymerase subunit RPC12/RpoP
MKAEFDERIEKMRNGEKVKCPKCESGFFSAVGNPKSTRVVRCDACHTGITLTIPFKKTQK